MPYAYGVVTTQTNVPYAAILPCGCVAVLQHAAILAVAVLPCCIVLLWWPCCRVAVLLCGRVAVWQAVLMGCWGHMAV